MKKLLVGVLVLVLLVTSVSFAAATVPEYVEQLSAVGLVKGDGTGFNLDGQLKRSEAMTMIVRLMGREDLVVKNKAYYSQLAKFSDVNATDWFAPYVGFLVYVGKVDGYPDGTFKPQASISEKETVKLVLTVLNYKYNTDFTWDNLYSKAHDFSVLKDAAYATKTVDNTNYKRGDIFKLTKDVLTTTYKNTTETIIDKWIKDQTFTADALKTAGLYTDQLKTSLVSAESKSDTLITLNLNEMVANLTTDQVKVTSAQGDISVSKVTVKDKVVEIVTSVQVPYRDYTVTLNNVTDKDGFVVSKVTGSFLGYKPAETVSNRFLISKIEGVSKDTIKIYFTQPITAVPTVGIFYDIYQDNSLWIDGNGSNMYLSKANDADNAVYMRLTSNVFDVYKAYKLKVSGTLTDATGLPMNNGSGDEIAFSPLVVDNFDMKRDMTYAFNKNVVTVGFTKALDKASAETPGNFQVLDSNNNTQVGVPKLDPNNPNQVLIGMLNPLTPGATYKLNILNPVYDIQKAKSVTETNVEFTVVDQTYAKFEPSLVETVSNSEIRVYFNDRINTSTLNLATFKLSSGSDANFNNTPFEKYLVDENNPTAVSLYFDPASKKMQAGVTYTLSIDAGLRNFVYQPVNKTTYVFTGKGTDAVSPVLTSGLVIGGKYVKLEFDKSISTANNTAANFKIKYTNADNQVTEYAPVTATVYSNKYILLTMNDTLDANKVYRAEYITVVDYRGNVFAGGAAKDSVLNHVQ